MKKDQLFVAIGRENGAQIKHKIEVPPSYWDKWYALSFQFHLSRNQKEFKVGDTQLTVKRIWVKERWFHRLWEWIYFKFHKPEVGQG